MPVNFFFFTPEVPTNGRMSCCSHLCHFSVSLVECNTPLHVVAWGYDVLTIGSGDVTFKGIFCVSRAYSSNVVCSVFFVRSVPPAQSHELFT